MWTRFSDMDRMFDAMELLRSRLNSPFWDMSNPLDVDFGWRVAEGVPHTNLYDAGDQVEVKAEVPGLAKEDLNIKIQGNYLEISGARKSEAPEGYKTHRRERGEATFTRSFTLPADVEVDKVGASLKDGLLSLTLPKSEIAKPKQITIK